VHAGAVLVWPCDTPRLMHNACLADAGYSLAVDTNCVVSVSISAPGPGTAAPAGVSPAAAPAAPAAPSRGANPTGGPGNGNGNNASGGGGSKQALKPITRDLAAE
jgi:hypothetical protein